MASRVELRIWEVPALGATSEPLVFVIGKDISSWVRQAGELILYRPVWHHQSGWKTLPVGFWVVGSYLKVLEVIVEDEPSMRQADPTEYTPFVFPDPPEFTDFTKTLTMPVPAKIDLAVPEYSIPEMPEYLKSIEVNEDIVLVDPDEPLAEREKPQPRERFKDRERLPFPLNVEDIGAPKVSEPPMEDKPDDDVKSLVADLRAPAALPPIMIPGVDSSKEDARNRTLAELGDDGAAAWIEKSGDVLRDSQ